MENPKRISNLLRFAAWAGMIGPILFVTAFTIEGWIRPGYDPLIMFVSELSLGPRGWIQVTNFMLFGALFLIFARGVAYDFKEKRLAKTGPILLTTLALGYFLSGPFVTDPGTIFTAQKSWHGIIHGILGGIVFVLMPMSCFMFARSFRQNSLWQSFRSWTLTAGIIQTTAVVFLILVTKTPAAPNALNELLGLVQRIAIIPYMIWLSTFAFRLYRQNKQGEVV